MDTAIRFDAELLETYEVAGPGYTSYPTAAQFRSGFTEADYGEQTQASNNRGRPLSLYVHIPLYNAVCVYVACWKIITANRQRTIPYLKRLGSEIELQEQLFGRYLAEHYALHFSKAN